jgi:hypothetical protein
MAYKKARELKAATTIQKYVRRYFVQKRYNRVNKAVVKIQTGISVAQSYINCISCSKIQG